MRCLISTVAQPFCVVTAPPRSFALEQLFDLLCAGAASMDLDAFRAFHQSTHANCRCFSERAIVGVHRQCSVPMWLVERVVDDSKETAVTRANFLALLQALHIACRRQQL